MKKPRILAATAAVVLVVVAGALTLRPGGVGAGPATSERVADGPVVDWAPSTAAEVAVDPASPAGPAVPADDDAGAAVPSVPIPDDPADDGGEAVHPADSPQTTLLAAAAAPVGPGVAGPAAGVTGDQTRPPVDPDDVLSATAARGGCALDYGDPGQCLPVQPPSAAPQAAAPGAWTCAEVQQLFPDGLAVHGTDPLHLDGDGNGIACGPGD